MATTELTITNPDAEAGVSTGWTPLFGGDIARKSSSPSPHGGSYYFYGGAQSYCYVVQNLEIPSNISQDDIDNGDVSVEIKWWQRSADDQDEGQLGFIFRDQWSSQLGSAYMSTMDIPDSTQWEEKTYTVDPIPEDATKIQLKINMERNDGTDLDFYLDDITVTFTHPSPTIDAEPGAYALTGSDADLISTTTTLAAEAGAYALTGSDATLKEPVKLAADSGLYRITGADADLYEPDALVFESFPMGVQRYILTLTGAADGVEDVDFLISNFQAEKRNGLPSSLSVTIPTDEYDAQIVARPNGKLRVTLEVIRDGVTVLSAKIAETHFGNIILYNGTSSGSVVLTGQQTESFVQKSLTIDQISYTQITNGAYRCRLPQPNIYVNPGDEVTVDGNTFVVDSLTYSVSPGSQTIEIAEAA